MFGYLSGGLMVSAWGALRGLLFSTLVSMAGGILFILFLLRDKQPPQAL